MPMATSSSTMHYKPLCNILSNHCAKSSFHYFVVTCAPNPNGWYFLSTLHVCEAPYLPHNPGNYFLPNRRCIFFLDAWQAPMVAMAKTRDCTW